MMKRNSVQIECDPISLNPLTESITLEFMNNIKNEKNDMLIQLSIFQQASEEDFSTEELNNLTLLLENYLDSIHKLFQRRYYFSH